MEIIFQAVSVPESMRRELLRYRNSINEILRCDPSCRSNVSPEDVQALGKGLAGLYNAAVDPDTQRTLSKVLRNTLIHNHPDGRISARMPSSVEDTWQCSIDRFRYLAKQVECGNEQSLDKVTAAGAEVLGLASLMMAVDDDW
jgi:hypothetical protein